ncbi:MAG: T9SS type A sorting domain-containing protein [Saprospiraceae bacterium]
MKTTLHHWVAALALNLLACSLQGQELPFFQTHPKFAQEQIGLSYGLPQGLAGVLLDDNDFRVRADRVDFWEDNALDKQDSSIYAYNNQNLLSEIKTRTYDGFVWVLSGRRTYQYDANKNPIENLYQNWDGASWQNSYRFLSVFNLNNQRIQETNQIWDGTAWNNAYLYISEYDLNNNLTVSLSQKWENGAWENHYRTIYDYNSDNKLAVSTSQWWENGSWVNSSRYILEYDANGQSASQLYQNWQGQFWETYSRTIYDYDANGNPTLYLNQSWTGTAWVNSYRFILEYDANGNMIRFLWQNWEADAWLNFLQVIQYFEGFTGTFALAQPQAVFQVFPNPSDGQFRISAENQGLLPGLLAVYDAQGRKVYEQQVGTAEQEAVSLPSTLSEGLYLLHLEGKRGSATQKLRIAH